MGPNTEDNGLLTSLDKEAIELAWIANAYMDGAERITEALIEDEHERSLHHFRVPLHLAHLAIELFLKAGICSAGRRPPATHDLQLLKEQYESVGGLPRLPVPSYLDEYQSSHPDLFDPNLSKPPRRTFERLRYYSDQAGRPYAQLELADLKQLQAELSQLHIAANWLLLALGCYEPR